VRRLNRRWTKDNAPDQRTAAFNVATRLQRTNISQQQFNGSAPHHPLPRGGKNSYTGPRYSIFFSNPYEFTGTYRQLPGYALVNIRAGIKFRDTRSATLFVNNLTNKHALLESMFTENEPQPDFTRIETNQPLTGGIDLTYRF
jgi:outer membrane receptor protein involved in Fe transport